MRALGSGGPGVAAAGAAAPRILLVTGGMDCGGAQRVMAGMANYWAVRQWDVCVATWTGPDVPDFYALDPKVSRAWLHAARRGHSWLATLRVSILRVLKLRRLIKESKPSAVISFIDVSNICTIIGALGLGVPVIVSERTNPSVNRTVSRPWRLLRRLCYRWASRVVAQTRDAADWIERQCRTPVAVIPNPLRPLPELSLQRECIIIAVGRLTPEKGIEVLLEAFARVRGHFPQWRLHVLGDGPEREHLQGLRDRLGLIDVAEFCGQVPDVEQWMARSGLLVHPSRREGFPNAVLEAMGSGAAVICADCPSGPAELIQDGLNGRLVRVGDVDELTRVMAELMEQPALRAALGHEAVRVRQRYAPEVIMAMWEQQLGLPQAERAGRT